MKRVAVLNLKGGIGKTTTATSLAYILAAKQGLNVLLIDCDMQGNASKTYGNYMPDGRGTHDIMTGTREVEYCIMSTLYSQKIAGVIDIIPSNMYLMQANADVLRDEEREQLHRISVALDRLDQIPDYKDYYNIVIMDCALGLDMTTLNAVLASDMVIAPVLFGGYEVDGLGELDLQLDDLRRIKPDIRLKALYTMRMGNKANREFEEWLKNQSGYEVFRTRDISIDDIYANEKNFYGITDIEELAEDIKAVGLLENLNVVYAPKDGRNYRLIGGERRWRALNLLVERGYNEFGVATCQIRNTDSTNAEIVEIILCNRQRVKTVWEQMEEERQLKEALQLMKAEGQTLKGYNLQEGRLRDTIAQILGYSAAKVGQMETIINRLHPEFQKALREEKINFSAAYTLAKMPEEYQVAALAEFQETGSMNSAEAERVAAHLQHESGESIPEESPEEPEEQEQPEYGTEQKNVISICYSCEHWGECREKSETTVKCATYSNKELRQQKIPEPQIVDSSTGEVYESMAEVEEAERTAEEHQEKRQEQESDEVETADDSEDYYCAVSKESFDLLSTGNMTYLIERAVGYEVGDNLRIVEYIDGEWTGRVLNMCVVCIDTSETSSAIADGYSILGVVKLE